MTRSKLNARLYLNDTEVGTVRVKGWDDSWGFGEFAPGEGFAAYAPWFGTWSLLMHADQNDTDAGCGRLSRPASAELRRVENEIDRIHARLFLVGPQEWRKISQLNIEGTLIEWKEDFDAGGGSALGAA
jgi:hypothetical protein